jgi:hypothetical protein
MSASNNMKRFLFLAFLLLALSACGVRDTTPAINFMIDDLPVYAHINDDKPICSIGVWDDMFTGWEDANTYWTHVTSKDGTCSGYAQVH